MRRSIRLLLFCTVGACFAMVCARHAFAEADGYFDSTWAGGGAIGFPGDFANPGNSSGATTQILIQSNGDILLTGAAETADTNYWWLGDLFSGGQFVPTFGASDGSGRIAACSLATGYCDSRVIDPPQSIVIQPDGKNLIFTPSNIWRTTAQAHALDTTGVAGGTGYVDNIFSINNVQGIVSATYGLPPLPDGKILAVGNGTYSAASQTSFGIVRLNADLSLDTTFNAITDGEMVTFAGGAIVTVSPTDMGEYPSGALLQPDGKILISGLANNTSTTQVLEFVRLMPDGSLDAMFGSSGTKVITPPYVTGDIGQTVLDRAGRILIAADGEITPGTLVFGILVARLNPDGSPDGSFGASGFTFLQFSSCTSIGASGLALDSAGRIVIAGSCERSGSIYEILVTRLRGDNGLLDTSFGINGLSLGAYTDGSVFDTANSIVFDQGGRPIVAGDTEPAKELEAGAARLTYDLIYTNNFETAPPGCLSPHCN